MSAAVDGYVAKGVPQPVAARVVALETLYSTLDIVEVADNTKRPVELVAQIYFDLSTRLGVPWLREKIAELPADQHWQMLAKGAMLDDLSGLQRSIASEVVTGGGDLDKSPGRDPAGAAMAAPPPRTAGGPPHYPPRLGGPVPPSPPLRGAGGSPGGRSPRERRAGAGLAGHTSARRTEQNLP